MQNPVNKLNINEVPCEFKLRLRSLNCFGAGIFVSDNDLTNN